MRIRRAVILAAGNGTRLGPLTADRPKALLDVGGRTLIDRQLDALHASGVRDVTVVVGYQEARLRRHLGRSVTYVRNERYRETNSLYSLWLASDQLNGGAFVLNADVLFTPLLIERLRWHPAPDALLYDSTRSLGPEETKVRLAGSYVVDMSKHMRPDVAAGESVGILKFGAEGSSRLVRVLNQLVTAGEEQAWVPRAVAELAHRWPIVAIDTDGLPWTEVDYPEDLFYAQHVVDFDIAATLTPAARCEEPQLLQAAGAR